MIKNIVLLTDAFPYIPGEEFLETELTYWQKENDIHLTIMPKMKTNKFRKISNNITVDTRLSYKKINKILYRLRALFHPLMVKEFSLTMLIKPIMLKDLISSISYFLFFRDILKLYILENKNQNILFYSYWHTEVAYALQSLKKEFPHIKVVSRTHGYDFYKIRRKYKYMPLKKQFVKGLDSLFVISDKAKEYAIKEYGFDRNNIKVARLGVKDSSVEDFIGQENGGVLKLVSCSYLVEVKRVDKIIDAIHQLSKKKIYKKIVWNHIGSGSLAQELENYAKSMFDNTMNVEYKFLGHIENKKIYSFYKKNNFDIFINVSESEGVPVTIMEAMSCKIPIIAPDIGGISEMITNEYNGILLSKESSLEEIVSALSMKDFFKSIDIKKNAYQVYKEKYSAETNYMNFIEKIKKV